MEFKPGWEFKQYQQVYLVNIIRVYNFDGHTEGT